MLSPDISEVHYKYEFYADIFLIPWYAMGGKILAEIKRTR